MSANKQTVRAPLSSAIDSQQNGTIKNGTRHGKHEQHASAGRRYDPLTPSMPSSDNTSSRILEGIYGRLSSAGEDVRRERLQQMNLWMSEKDGSAAAGTRIASMIASESDEEAKAEPLKSGPFLLSPILVSPVYTPKGGIVGTGGKLAAAESKKSPMTFSFDELPSLATGEADSAILHHSLSDRDILDRMGASDDDPDNVPDDEDNHHSSHRPEANGPVGTSKTPPCGSQGRFYCSYKEDYPNKVVSEVSKYYKWPLEKLFRDLRQQVMPKLANDNYGGLVCDSLTRVVRPGWARNTNNRWLVVINTDHYQQFVTEVICRNGPSAHCNFIPPCYQATCAQRYNTQKLLVIDPWNPYKGPFVSEFLFPSCCICYVPSYSPGEAASTIAGTGSRRMDKTPYADRRTSETSTAKNEL